MRGRSSNCIFAIVLNVCNGREKTYAFQWVLIVHLLLQIYFCLVMSNFIFSLCDNRAAFFFRFFLFVTISRLLNIDNPYFKLMVLLIYPIQLQLKKANSFDTDVPIINLELSITNVIIKNYGKRDGLKFRTVHFLFLGGDDPRSPFYDVHILQFTCFARVRSYVSDFKYRNQYLTAKLLNKAIYIIKVRKGQRSGIDTINHHTLPRKVTTSQLDIKNKSQEVSPFPAGGYKASINRCPHKHNKNKPEIT